MALIAEFLIDTSAAARMPLPSVRARLEPLITGGLVGTCATLDAEALHSAPNLAEYEQVLADRRTTYGHLPIDDDHWTRAFQGHHEGDLNPTIRPLGDLRQRVDLARRPTGVDRWADRTAQGAHHGHAGTLERGRNHQAESVGAGMAIGVATTVRSWSRSRFPRRRELPIGHERQGRSAFA